MNQRWSLDFVSDALADGRKIRIMTVIDEYNRVCLGIVIDTSLSGARMGRELDRLIDEYGQPETILSDNGTEFTTDLPQKKAIKTFKKTLLAISKM